MADEIVKRLRYFEGQFLEAEDFTAEQDYHIGMRRTHNRMLYTAGILDGGFLVEKMNHKKIKIGPGVGVDADGKELVIITPVEKDLPVFDQNTLVYYVLLSYEELKDDSKTAGDNVSDHTRWVETPFVELVNKATFDQRDAGQKITLAKITLDEGNGDIKEIDTSVRQLALSKLRYPSTWVRLPFLPKSVKNKPSFELNVYFASCNGAVEVAGSMEIPIPLGMTRINRFRIAGKKNQDILTVELYRVNYLDGDLTPISLLEEKIKENPNEKFDKIWELAAIGNAASLLDPETSTLAVMVSTEKAAEIWFIAVEFMAQ